MKAKLGIKNMFIALIAVIWLLVSVVIGIITEADGDYFWMSFGFLSFSAVVAIALLLIFGGKTVKDLFFAMPIYYVGAVYFAVSGILSAANMLLDIINTKWMFVLQLIILVVFIVYLVLCLVNKENAENVIEKVKVKNDFIRNASTSIGAAAAICSDRETKIKLESLAEEFKYSAPASGDELYAVETRMEMTIRELSGFVRAGDLDNAKKLIDTLKMDLIERNALAKK